MKRFFKKLNEISFALAFAMTNFVAMSAFAVIGGVAAFVHIVQEMLLAYEPMVHGFEDKMQIHSYAMVHHCMLTCMIMMAFCCVLYVIAASIDDFVSKKKKEKLPE